MTPAPLTTPDTVLQPRVEEVAEGVFAYLQLHGQWGLNNAGFITGNHHTLVIDTCFTVPRATALRTTIEATSASPIRTLANTHHHGDHTHGNFLFPDATIIGHERCREEVLRTDLAGTQALFEDGIDWGDIELAPPTVTFRDRLALHVDDIRIEALHVGPAHTNNDVIYHLPEQGVLFAGDLAFAGGTPFVLMGSVVGSLRAYERIAELDVETVVPGHGPVCGPTVFADAASYLRFVHDAAEAGRRSGLTPLELARDLDLGDFAGWHDAERIVGNLHRAYADLDGDPGARIAHGPAIDDMIKLNGGRRLRCHA